MQVGTDEIGFSVAIATYNRCGIIGETLQYVLEQTHAPIEVVVVDDGSDDSTAEVIASIQDPRIRYHRIDNVGPGAALRVAIEACTSSWITICDDDDMWRADHLQRRANLLRSYPAANFTFSDFSAFGSGARPNYSHFATISADWWDHMEPPDAQGYRWLGKDALWLFLRENPVFPLTACFSRELWERSGGIDDKFSWLGCWDAHLTWRLALHGTVACDTHITAERREHLNNFSKKRSQVNLERAKMLETIAQDGWMPETYTQMIEEQITVSKARAASWAWNDCDYVMLRKVVREMPVQFNVRYLGYLLAIILPGFLTKRLR